MAFTLKRKRRKSSWTPPPTKYEVSVLQLTNRKTSDTGNGMKPRQNDNRFAPLNRWFVDACGTTLKTSIWGRCSGQAICFFLLFGPLIAGCMPRVIVRAHPTPNDQGIRYYRPKPFLKVEPAEVALEKNQTTIMPGVVRISLVYLPDFSEEYAIDVRSGLGIANVGIKLEDGWNLTEISQELDSQADENVRGVASLLSAVGDISPTSGSIPKNVEASFTVSARNVPLGFYESIIGRDSRGCKRLYGFRYVGFVPFTHCPVDGAGQQSLCCSDPESGLYGLSFVNGQMVFLPLDEMAHSSAVDATKPAVSTSDSPKAGRTSAVVSPADPLTLRLPESPLSALEIQLRAHLSETFDGIGEVRATASGERTMISVKVPLGAPTLPIRNSAEAWLQSVYGARSHFDIELSH